MWTRLTSRLRCPLSGEALEVVAFKERTEAVTREHRVAAEQAGLSVDGRFCRCIDAGVLLAPSAGFVYPIARGLPVLLPYETAIHRRFAAEFAIELSKFLPRYTFPSCKPMPGERAVFRSFSREWAGYKYDGVIWDVSYGDNERRLLAEVGVSD